MTHAVRSSLAFIVTTSALAALLPGCSCGGGTEGLGRTHADTGVDARGGLDAAIDAAADAGEDLDASTIEQCNGVDDNGDGRVDEGCACAAGSTQSCWPGDREQAGVGLCAPGTQACVATSSEFGAWGACTGATPPDAEVCDDQDNDCNGVVDDGCTCTLGASASCYGGPAGTEGIGRCRAGTARCVAGAGGVGSAYGACTGDVQPGTEACNGTDDDCDGAIDEGCGCTDGTARACYTGPAGTEGVGLCVGGMQYCTPDSTGMAAWGACTGVTLPSADRCNGIDDDCDGVADEDCHCAPGAARACWDGPAAARGLGACRDGVQTCTLSADGTIADWGACSGERLPSAELCNASDDNCDGMIDEGCGCVIGTTRSCYSGPPETIGHGTCVSGTQSCTATTDGHGVWSTCTGEVPPGSEVCGDGIDGDCDGVIDDGCYCTSATGPRACYVGPSATRNVGLCRDGAQACVVGAGGVGADWGTCTGGTLPVTEICDGLDNNCNGTTDEGCGCTPGAARTCYGGPAGTADVGICRSGSQTCDTLPDGSAAWSPCAGVTLPGTESCNGRDDDCNGVADEGCSCSPGATQPCYAGPPSTRGVGICGDGAQTCVSSGTGSSWGSCTGSALPQTETCNGRDDDCNGATDEGCSCTPRSTRTCYSGPTGTSGVGACHPGTQTCNLSADGTMSSWGACTGAALPGAEVCNGVDDDCDGTIDQGCNCVPGATRACYGGPAGTRGLGICRDGAQTCVSGAGGVGSDWGTCTGWTGPASEICNGSDDNCDGRLDEGCACSSGQTRACYSGPPVTRAVGVCHDGSQTCVITGGVAGWGTCTGERLPMSESCNAMDDNCNGTTDEGVCLVPPIVTCPAPLTTRPFVPVTLSGTASDPDGGVISTWSWTLVSAPAGASGTFSSPSSQTTQFTPNLVGVYTVRLTVVDDDGQSASCTTTVTATGLGIRVEVIWTTNGSDVDTHLLRMASGQPWFGSPQDCYFSDRTPSWDAAGTADDPRLDIDDVDGYGPENINLDVPVTGSTYRVGIHYWSDHGTGPTSVTVRVYCGDISVTPVTTMTRTLTGSAASVYGNDFWRVADVRWLGGDSCSVTTIDTVTAGTNAQTTP